jgi:hypothetical protein
VKKLLIALFVIAVIALLGVAWYVRPKVTRFYSDADSIRQAEAEARIRDILWQPPTPLEEIVNTGDDDYEPRLSADGLTLYFVRGKAGGNADIHACTRTHEGWTVPTPVPGVNSPYDDLGPEPTADGQSLYFYSDRHGGRGGYDLWVAHRGPDGWRAPVNLGPTVNSEFNDYGPAVTPDGTTLYFASNRPRPDDERKPDPAAWHATLREDYFHRDYDLYIAAVTDSGFGRAEPLDTLNTTYNDGAPAVTPFGDFLYFSSDRPGGEGGYDLYRSRRLHGGHKPPDNLGPSLNTAAHELDPALSLGGYGLHFSSDRNAKQQTPGETADYDLFYTTSREVFRETEVQRASIDWGGLWRQILPNLLWALFALLLLLALLALLRGARGRKLSLLVRCLLASLLAHLVLMLILNFWGVTAAIADAVGRGGRIEIALAPSVGADEMVAQIRGRLTNVESPEARPTTFAHQVADLKFEPKINAAQLIVERVIEHPDEPPNIELPIRDAPNRLEQSFKLETPAVNTQSTRTVQLELATPRAQQPASDPEPDPAPAIAPILPSRPVRSQPTQAVGRSQLTNVALRPDTSRSANSPAAAESLANRTAIRDAASQHEAKPVQHTAWAPIQPAPAAEVALPNAPLAQTAASEAVHSRIRAESTSPPRFEAELTETQEEEFTPAALMPKTTPRSSSDTAGLAPDAAPESRSDEVRVAQRFFAGEGRLKKQPSPGGTTDPVESYLAELTLPDTPSLSTAPAEEAQPAVASRLPAPPRAATSTSQSTSATHQNIQPVAVPKMTDASILSAVDTPSAEAAPAFALSDSPRTHQLPPIPSPPDIALPDVEQLRRQSNTDARSPIAATASAAVARPSTSFFADTLRPDALDAENLRPVQSDSSHPVPRSLVAPNQPPADRGPHRRNALPPVAKIPPSIPTPARPDVGLRLPTELEPIEEEISVSKSTEDAVGTLEGYVTDAFTGEPLEGAEVRLVVPDRTPIIAYTDSAGAYTLHAPTVPDFFALSASLDGYVPASANVEAARLIGTKLWVDFELQPKTDDVFAVEAVPDVHHLGDDAFDGRINSQFQKHAEGADYVAEFELTERQLTGRIRYSEIWMLAKGVQRPHPIRINGHLLDRALDEAPRDGSFGEFVVRFDPTYLQAGNNVFHLHATARLSDIDDFEFVNVRIRLVR